MLRLYALEPNDDDPRMIESMRAMTTTKHLRSVVDLLAQILDHYPTRPENTSDGDSSEG